MTFKNLGRKTLKTLAKLIAVAGLTLAVAAPAPLLAEGPAVVNLGITPLEYPGPYFDLQMAPGETRTLKVEVGNYGSEAVEARTYAADAYTIVNGGFGARLDGEPVSGPTLWLDYPAQTINLPAGKALQRSFTVAVPPDTLPGEYITSLVVQNAEPIAGPGGSVALLQVKRKAIAVAIAVSGSLPPAAPLEAGRSQGALPLGGAQGPSAAERGLLVRHPALRISDAEHKYVATASVVTVGLTNTGNVHLRPLGDFLLYDEDGLEVSRFRVVMDTVYAGGSTKVEVPFTKALLPGKYLLRLQLDYEGGAVEVNDLALAIPRPTRAELQGDTTRPDGRASVNQVAASTRGISTLLVVSIFIGGMSSLAPFLAYAILRRLRSRR